MNRDDFMLVGCGGGGNKLVDDILNEDPRFTGYFINSSMTDIKSLTNYDEVDKNFLCISTQNGAGGDRELGKLFAGKKGWNMIDTIRNFPQKHIYLGTSFGGASGNTIVSSILQCIKEMKEEGVEFDKIINLIGILPKLDSVDRILKNTLESWNEILSADIINNMIFIDNGSMINGRELKEHEINQSFAELFNSIFDIPSVNGRNFDNGNLSKVLNSKGCMYIYNLQDGCSSVEQAFKQADTMSVLAKMYKSPDNLVLDPNDDKEKISCSYLGTSFNDENYNHSELLSKFRPSDGRFEGYNEDNNLVIVSGCFPPFYSIQVIKAELEDRERSNAKSGKADMSKFIIDYKTEVKTEEVKNEVAQTVIEQKPKSSNSMKNMMKKKRNIFDIGK